MKDIFLTPSQQRLFQHVQQCLDEGLGENVVLISGPAGSGKTWLLQTLASLLPEKEPERTGVAVHDFSAPDFGEHRASDSLAILLALRNQLVAAGAVFLMFDLAVAVYLHKRGLLTPERIRALFPFEARPLLVGIRDILRDLPREVFAREILNLFGAILGKRYTLFMMQRKLSEEKIEHLLRFAAEPDLYDRLVEFFLADLTASLHMPDRHSRFVLIFDALESYVPLGHAQKLPPWLPRFIEEVQKEKNILLILAAQNEATFPAIKQPGNQVKFTLESPSRSLQGEFLRRSRAAREGAWPQALQKVVEQAEPEYTFHEIALLNDFVLNKKAEVDDAEALVEELLGRKGQISLRQFLRLCDRDMTHALITLSAARTFTADLFMYLGKVFHFNDTQELFRRITALSFVRKTTGGKHDVYRMAPHAREHIRRYSRQIRNNAHRALEHYFRIYAHRCDELARVEAIYHLNQFHEEKGIHAWLNAFRQALSRQEFRFCRALLTLAPELTTSSDYLRARIVAAQAEFALQTRRYNGAADILPRALFLFEQATEADRADLAAQNGLGLALLALARAHEKNADHEKARELIPRALVAFETALKRNALWLPALINKGTTLTLMGELFHRERKVAEAENSFLAAIKCCEAALESAPGHRLALQALLSATLALGTMLQDVRGPHAALHMLEPFMSTALNAPTLYRARMLFLQAMLQAECGDTVAALAGLERAAGALAEFVDEHPGEFRARKLLGRVCIQQARLLQLDGADEAAGQKLQQAAAVVEPVLWALPEDPGAEHIRFLAAERAGKAGDSLPDHLRYGEPDVSARSNAVLSTLARIDSLLREGEHDKAQTILEGMEDRVADQVSLDTQAAYWLRRAECSLTQAEYEAGRLALEMAWQTLEQELEGRPYSQPLNRLALQIALTEAHIPGIFATTSGAGCKAEEKIAAILEKLEQTSPENLLLRAEALLILAKHHLDADADKASAYLEQANEQLALGSRWQGMTLHITWLLGRMFYQLGRVAVARASYDQADEAYITSLQHYNQCLEVLPESHALKNDKALSLIAYSEVLRLRTRFGDAEEFARGAIELTDELPESDPDFINSRAMACNCLADVAVAIGSFDEALEAYKQADALLRNALKQWPGNQDILQNQLVLLLKVARLLISLGKTGTAGQLLSRAQKTLGKLMPSVLAGSIGTLLSAQLAHYQAELLIAQKQGAKAGEKLNQAVDILQQTVNARKEAKLQLHLANVLQTSAWQHTLASEKETALSILQQAVNHYTEISDRLPADVYARYNTGLALARLGFLYTDMGRLEEAMYTFRDALNAYETALQIMPERSDLQQKKGDILLAAGLLNSSVGNQDDAAESLQVAARAFEQALAAMPKNVHALYNRGIALLHLGELQVALDRKGQAIWSFRTATESFDAVLAIEPDQPMVLKNRAEASHALGELQFSFSQFQDAADHFREAVSTYDKVLELSTDDSQSKVRKARSLFRHGVVLDLLRERKAAIRALGKAANLCHRLLREGSGNGMVLQVHADSLRELGRIYRSQEQYAEAEQAYLQAIRFLDYQTEGDQASIELKLLIKGRTQSNLAEMKSELSLLQEASEIYRQAIESLNDAIAESPDFVPAHFEMGLAFAARGHLQQKIGDTETAMSDFGRAISAFEEVVSREAEHVGALFNKGTVLADLGKLQLELGLLSEAKYSLKSAYDQITHTLHVDQSEVAFHNARKEIKALIDRLDEAAAE